MLLRCVVLAVRYCLLVKCVLFCCGPSLAVYPYPAAENTVLYNWPAKQHIEGTADTDATASRLKEATAMLRWH
jgi:hypothetical protein